MEIYIYLQGIISFAFYLCFFLFINFIRKKIHPNHWVLAAAYAFCDCLYPCRILMNEIE